MLNQLRKIITDPESRTTYYTGLLQTKAYRILKDYTASYLEPYHISTVEWALLGILKAESAGLRLLALSEALGVEQPFVTVLALKLNKQGYIQITPQKADKRVKIATLTQAGERFVQTTERELRKHMRPLLHGATIRDLLGYLKVLSLIVENGEGLEDKTNTSN